MASPKLFCYDCVFFGELGKCLNPEVPERYRLRSYFDPCCELFSPRDMSSKTTQTKHCAKCGRDLPLDAFNKSAGRKDGRQTYCRECQKKGNAKSKSSMVITEYGGPADNSLASNSGEDLSDLELKSSLRATIEELRRRGYDIECIIKTAEVM